MRSNGSCEAMGVARPLAFMSSMSNEREQTQFSRTHAASLVYSWKLRPGVGLHDMTLQTLSPKVVVGLMAVSLTNSK